LDPAPETPDTGAPPDVLGFAMTEAGVRGGDLCAVGSAVEARDRPFRSAGTARRGEQTGLDGQSCMIEFQPVLLRQRDNVIEDDQPQRADVFN
jgi:hypothetical protein